MTAASNLLRRGATYYARMQVPLDLVETIGRTERVKALGTKDLRDVKCLLRPVIEAWERDGTTFAAAAR